MNNRITKNIGMAICGTYVAIWIGVVGYMAYQDWKSERERAKLKILREEFDGNEELIKKYMAGDIIDAEVV